MVLAGGAGATAAARSAAAPRRLGGAIAALALALWLAPPRIERQRHLPVLALRCCARRRPVSTTTSWPRLGGRRRAARHLGIGRRRCARQAPRRCSRAPPRCALATALLTARVRLCAGARAARWPRRACRTAASARSLPHLANAGCPGSGRIGARVHHHVLVRPAAAEFTDARAAEIAAAGFNVVGAPCEGAVDPALNRRALDIAARHGLRVWITDDRLSQYDDLAPRLGGAAGRRGRRLRRPSGARRLLPRRRAGRRASSPTSARSSRGCAPADPQRVPYINLLPDFAPPEALGTATYREHVEQFMAHGAPAAAQLRLLSVQDRRRPRHVLRQSRPSSAPPRRSDRRAVHAHRAGHAARTVPRSDARPRSPGRCTTRLAFGARGISYFAYWTPVHVEDADRWQFRNGLVENGAPTEHFAAGRAHQRDDARHRRPARRLALDRRRRLRTAASARACRSVRSTPSTAGRSPPASSPATAPCSRAARQPGLPRARRITLRLRPGARRPRPSTPAAARWQRLDDGRARSGRRRREAVALDAGIRRLALADLLNAHGERRRLIRIPINESTTQRINKYTRPRRMREPQRLRPVRSRVGDRRELERPRASRGLSRLAAAPDAGRASRWCWSTTPPPTTRWRSCASASATPCACSSRRRISATPAGSTPASARRVGAIWWRSTATPRSAPECLARLVAAADRWPNAGMFAPKILSFDDRRVLDNVGHLLYPDGLSRGRGRLEPDRGQYDREEEIMLPSGCAVLLRRAMLADIGLFDADLFAYCDDTDLGLRAPPGGLALPQRARRRRLPQVLGRERRVLAAESVPGRAQPRLGGGEVPARAAADRQPVLHRRCAWRPRRGARCAAAVRPAASPAPTRPGAARCAAARLRRRVARPAGAPGGSAAPSSAAAASRPGTRSVGCAATAWACARSRSKTDERKEHSDRVDRVSRVTQVPVF